MLLLARLIRSIFKLRFLRKYYFGFYTRVLKPLSIFRGRVITASYNGDQKMILHLDDWIQQQIYFLDYYDRRGIEYIKMHFRANNTFIDIGANVGSYSLVASGLAGKSGKVYAFEPVSHVYRQLSQNIELNNISNIIAEPLAIYEQKKLLDIHVSDLENTGMSSIFRHDHESGETQRVQAIVFDDYVMEHDIREIQIIKMDIEGAELHALKGMQMVLKNLRPCLIIELSPTALENAPTDSQDIISYLAGFNYSPRGINSKGELFEPGKEIPAYTNYVFLPDEVKLS